MRSPKSLLVLAGLLALVASACTSSSGGQAAAPTGEPVNAETPTVATEDEPTVAPTPPPLTEIEILDAALQAFEADPQPTELIAFDLIEVRQRGTTGVTEVVVCGWRNDTIFNQTYLISYRVRQNDDGTPTVAFESANTISQDCLNTEMVESALQFTRDYEAFWSTVVANPSTFEEDEAKNFWTAEFATVNALVVQGWIDEGLRYEGSYFDGGLPDTAIADMLWRSYSVEEFEVFEIISCRDLSPSFGLYRGDVLIDDLVDDRSIGNHVILRYLLVHAGDQWELLSTDARVRTDCFVAEDGWLNAVNRAFDDPVPWEVLPS